jgi:5-methyltetrahydropteroyltriglutamate--homocysteine methyltransferase
MCIEAHPPIDTENTMKRSVDRILTTHTGSLPRPRDLEEMIVAREQGQVDPAFDKRVEQAVQDVVRRQAEVGLDIINDGEQGKVNYVSYFRHRVSGFEGEPTPGAPQADVLEFPDFYKRVWWATPEAAQNVCLRTCNGPIKVKSLDSLRVEIANLKAAADGSGAEEVFMSAVSPGLIATGHANAYYPTRGEYLAAIASAMREEYEEIAKAGFILQLDCPDLAMAKNMWFADKTLDEFRRLAFEHVEALNDATRNIDPDQMRMHVCWGNSETPHHRDVALADILDIILSARPNGVALEAANPRHQHEWRVFEDQKLPDGKLLIPGVLDTTTNFIEHPEVVAQRLGNYVRVVGQENVIPGNDCGFGTAIGLEMVDRNVAWAKVEAMVEGARIATRQLAAAGV